MLVDHSLFIHPNDSLNADHIHLEHILVQQFMMSGYVVVGMAITHVARDLRVATSCCVIREEETIAMLDRNRTCHVLQRLSKERVVDGERTERSKAT